MKDVHEKESISSRFEFNCLPEGYAEKISDIVRQQLNALQKAAYANSATMTEEEWLEARNEGEGGIGGSDASVIMDVSPFSNVTILYLELTKKIKVDKSADWFRLEYGHCTEPLIAKCFCKKFKAAIINDCGMYKHPDYDFIRANMDRLAILPTGELVILECKSTNPFAKSAWEKGAPEYYVWQGRHYLMVVNTILRNAGLPMISKVYYSALYGNTESELIFRKIEYNEIIDKCLLDSETDFWLNHVKARKIPKFKGNGRSFKDFNITYRMELSELNQCMGQKEEQKNDEIFLLDEAAQSVYDALVTQKAKISVMKENLKAEEDIVSRLEGEIVSALEGRNEALLPCGIKAVLKSKVSRSTDYELMGELYPHVYRECVSECESKAALTFKKPKKEKKERKKEIV